MGKESKDSTGTALATIEQKRLDELEAIIAAGFQGFADAGAAFREIRDSKLYRGTHATFEAYCPDVWGLKERQVYYLIEAASVAALLETRTTVQVPNARVARELAPLADKPEELVGAWQRAVEEHGTPTAAQVRKIVQPEPPLEPVTPGEVEVEPPIAAEATAKRKELAPGPKAPARSPSTLASFTRAFNAALADGWSLREISAVMDRVYRERDA